MYFLFHSSGEMYFFSVTGAIHVQFINLWKSGISTEKLKNAFIFDVSLRGILDEEWQQKNIVET